MQVIDVFEEDAIFGSSFCCAPVFSSLCLFLILLTVLNGLLEKFLKL